MKKASTVIAVILLVCSFLAWDVWQLEHPVNEKAKRTLVIYNWGDYLDPALIKKFEHQSGCHVQYETFDSNEAMLTKVRQGGTAYDLIFPSEYMVSKMRRAHLLAKIKRSKIPNLKYLAPSFLHQSFDPHNRYSVPYFWGTLGIVYNDQLVNGQEVRKWNDLWRKKYRRQIFLVDSARDAMGIALITLGFSMNTKSSLKLHLAQAKLDALGPNLKAIVADEMKMYLVQKEAAIGVTWSGEAQEMMANNRHLHYLIPGPSSNLWFDNFAIPRTAKNKRAAYQFINFMLAPKNAAQNARYVGYATPNQAARQMLPAHLRQNRQIYPKAATLRHLQVYRDLGARINQEDNDLFLEFKMNGR